MHLKKKVASKPLHKARHHEDHPHEVRGLSGALRFFVDHTISVAVASVARQQARTARLALTGASGTVMHVLVSTTEDGDGMRFIAYSNDMCLFVGSSPSLYVVDQTPRGLEHSIYLYISEKLAGESSVFVQIFRESTSLFELPVLEGSSMEGPRSLKPRAGAAIG